jgi:hypothetical protein
MHDVPQCFVINRQALDINIFKHEIIQCWLQYIQLGHASCFAQKAD